MKYLNHFREVFTSLFLYIKYMKFLKKFKIFESVVDTKIEIEIKDILLEASDLDYYTDFNNYYRYSMSDKKFIGIGVHISKSGFKINEVGDCLDRIIEYIYSINLTPTLLVKDEFAQTIISYEELENGISVIPKYIFEDYEVGSILIKGEIKNEISK